MSCSGSGVAMAATSDWRLYQLYMEFGEAQDRRARANEAADAYALALYYARRLNDPARINECRQLVLARSPNHIAAQAVSAPLFFAQLLMRYPADEVELALSAGRPGVAVAEEPPPYAQAPPSPERTFRRTQTIKPIYEGIGRNGQHHHAEPTFVGMSQDSATPFVSDDVLLADAGLLDDVDDEVGGKRIYRENLSTAVKALATGTIASGLLLVAYLGYSLYPMMNQMQRGASANNSNAPDKVLVADDATPPKLLDAPKKSEDPVVAPPPPAQAIVAKKTPAIAESGANTPVSLPDEPSAKISAKPSDGDTSRQ